MISIEIDTPLEVALKLAQRVKMRRLELDLTQAGLARRAGVKLPTYRKFERTGEISLVGLLNIAFALDALDEFGSLFTTRRYRNLDEAISQVEIKRKRGKRI